MLHFRAFWVRCSAIENHFCFRFGRVFQMNVLWQVVKRNLNFSSRVSEGKTRESVSLEIASLPGTAVLNECARFPIYTVALPVAAFGYFLLDADLIFI